MAFENCTGLTSVVIPNSLTGIGYSAFSGCTGLTSVTILSGVKSIGQGAFKSCTGLTSITFPASVTHVGGSFIGCKNLKNAYFLGDAPSMAGAFIICASSFTLYYIEGKSGFDNLGYPTAKFIPKTPVITITPYTTTPINGDITVTASTDIGILNAESHIFTENSSFEFVATDDVGNVTKQIVIITNIDKTAPVITIAPYTTAPINGEIVVTASPNEGTLNTKTHIFTANGSFEFVATDLAGNVTRKKVTVTNIYKVSAPTGLVAVSASYNSVKLTWKAVVKAGYTVNYTVYRYNGSTYVAVKNLSATSFVDASLATGTKYIYKVSAYIVVGKSSVGSGLSGYASAVPTLGTPSAFTAARYSASSIKLSFGAVAGASGYTIYRYNASTKKYVVLTNVTATSYVNSGLVKKSTYYYKVAAYHLEGKTKVYGAVTAIKSAKTY